MARKILRIKSGSYHRNSRVGRFRYWCEKIYLILRYDWQSIHKRIIRSIKFRVRVKRSKSVAAILQNNSAFLAKIPDGTWGLSKNDKLETDSEPFLLKFR